MKALLISQETKSSTGIARSPKNGTSKEGGGDARRPAIVHLYHLDIRYVTGYEEVHEEEDAPSRDGFGIRS